MNAFGYHVNRVAGFFGIRRTKHLRQTMTQESMFLNEAMELLGRAAWRDSGGIDDLAVEYWQIRDVEKKQRELWDESEALRSTKEELEVRRANIDSGFGREVDVLKEKKIELMSKAIVLMREIEAAREELERVKRRFAGMRLRLKAIDEEPEAAAGLDRHATEENIESARTDYADRQKSLEEKEAALKEVEKLIEENDGVLAAKKAELKQAAAEVVGEIGRVSKTLADLSAQIGSLQNEKNQLSTRVGRYLSQNIDSRSQEIRQILHKHRALASKISYFRKSIDYQQRLARF